MISDASILILLKLVLAHIAGDFIFQPKSWVDSRNKKHLKSPYLYIHCLIQASLAYIAVWQWSALFILPLVFFSHLVIDWIKSYNKKHLVLGLVFDQLAHVVILAIIWYIVTKAKISIGPNTWNNKIFLSRLIAYLMVTAPVSILIDTFIKAWKPDLKNDDEGLLKAGKWIGYMERVLVLTFVLIGKYEAIGYFLAAKSIFRIGGDLQSDHRKNAEYILVGSLLSFGSAILIGYATGYYF